MANMGGDTSRHLPFTQAADTADGSQGREPKWSKGNNEERQAVFLDIPCTRNRLNM